MIVAWLLTVRRRLLRANAEINQTLVELYNSPDFRLMQRIDPGHSFLGVCDTDKPDVISKYHVPLSELPTFELVREIQRRSVASIIYVYIEHWNEQGNYIQRVPYRYMAGNGMVLLGLCSLAVEGFKNFKKILVHYNEPPMDGEDDDDEDGITVTTPG